MKSLSNANYSMQTYIYQEVKNEMKKEEKEIYRKDAKSAKKNHNIGKKAEDTNSTICYSTSPYIIK